MDGYIFSDFVDLKDNKVLGTKVVSNSVFMLLESVKQNSSFLGSRLKIMPIGKERIRG